MLDPSLRNGLVELLSGSFRTGEINEIGKLLFPSYDTHRISGADNHISLAPRKSAGFLVHYCHERGELPALIQLVAELDGGTLLGRSIGIGGLEEFLHRLTSAGHVYDFTRRKLLSVRTDPAELVNWGSLKDGKVYPITVLSLDIVDNSGLVRRHGALRMERLYYCLWRFLKDKLKPFDGRFWHWAGDGGVAAFAFKGQADRAVHFALEVQRTLPLFNAWCEHALPEATRLRLGLDTGKIKFFTDTGKIVSETINFACHLEKNRTLPGSVCISREVRDSLNPRIRGIFRSCGIFEEREYFSTACSLDVLAPEAQEVPAAMPAVTPHPPAGPLQAGRPRKKADVPATAEPL